MNNISGGIEVARAAPPPKKTESVQPQKGDDDFKKYLEACSQEDEQKKAAAQPEDEAVKKATEAAVLLLQVATVPVEAVQVEIPAAEVESAPIVAAPVVTEEAPVQVEAQAQVEAAPVKAEAAPVQAQAKATTSSFAENLKAAEGKPTVEAAAPAPASRAEAAPVTAAPVKAAEAKVVVDEQPVVKPVKTEAVEEQPVVAAPETIAAKVAVDVSAARVETRPLELVRQMSKEITGMVAVGKNELHIQIQPENMGRIDVRLVSNSDGMQVVLTTDSAATGKMLENNLSQLQKSLSEAGLQISGMSVNSQGTQGQFSNTFRDQAPSIPQYYPKQTVAAVPVEAIAARYTNPLSGLDFRA